MSNAFDPTTAKPVSASNKSGNVFDPSTAKPVEEPGSRNVLAVVNDTAIELANAAAGGVSSAANFIKPGNAVSGFIDKNIVKVGEEKQSDAVRAEKKRYADEMAAAKGIGDEVGATLGYVARNPVLAAAQAAGSFAGPGAAIKGFGVAAKALGAGAKAVTNAGRVGGVVASGAMAGGDAAGTAHELAKNAGATDEQAVEAGRQASMIPGAIGAVTGAFGAEKLLAGAKGFGGSAAARAIKTGASEALQEGIEEGVTQYEGQRAAMPYDPSIDPTKGVAGAATMGAVLGGATGGGVSLLTPGHGSQPEMSGGMRDGAAAFAAGEPRTPPESIKSVVAKAQWVRGWDAAANAQSAAAEATGAAVNQEEAWTTSAGAAGEVQPGTAPASPANAPNLDYETLPGAAPDAVGNEIDFVRDFAAPDWSTEAGAAASAPEPQLTPSQAMGLDPKAGALSKAAVMAVDSGATASLTAPAEQAPAAGTLTDAAQAVDPQAGMPSSAAAPGVDPDTGEISLQAQMNDLRASIGYMQQQGKAQGWSKDMVAQRNALQSQLTKLEVQSAAGQAQGASTTGAPAPAQLSGITQILAKQVPDMSEQELQQAIAHYGPNHKRTAKLEKALQALAQQTLTAIETGANDNVSQASQAQQGSAQPAQATRAQATASGPSAVGEAARIAKEGNAQREQDRQRQLDASERWMRMTTVERQAITQASKGLNAPQRANVHKAAWGDLSEKVRAKLADAMGNQTAVAGKDAGNKPLALVNKAQVATESVANPSTGQTPVKQGAQPVGDEKPFAPETGTLGIPRADMPQVPTANHGGMVKHLNAQGIAHETTMVDAAALKPTQAEFSPSKVEAAKTAEGDRAVIVSSDGHIIDGHHQAVAAAEEGKQVKAIVLDAPVEQALAAVKASPSANAAPASAPATEPTPAPAPKSVPQRMKEAKAAKDEAAASKRVAKPKSIPAKMREAMAARADYFTPGNIVKGYSGHDRVIAYTTRDSHGGWSVTVQAVRKQGDGWVNEANEGPRTHTTQPTARDLKAGPVERGIDVLGREDELPFSRSTLEAPQTDQEKALVLQGAPVAEVDTAIAPMGAPAIRSWATDLFEQQGGKAHNPALGDVMLDGRSVRSSLAHGRPNAHKVAAFAAVKDVLEKGAVVLSARHGRDGDSFYVSAPVKVGGAINIVTVLVKRDPNDQRMYLHSVATKEYLLNRRVSRTDTTSGVERSGSNDSGDASTLAKQRDVGKASTEEVADELHRLLTLNAGERADNASTTARFRREAADTATGADFDVASFLQIMNEGQPASAAAAAAPAMNVRPSYSSAARAEAVRAVTGTADAIRQAWANGPEVIVAFDMQDPVVPESARRADLKQRSGGARGAPEGFYYQGKVYLMASKLKTPNDAARVLFHEALGHHGLRGLFGKELGQILNQVANMREKEVDAKISEYGLRGVSKLDRRTAAEEVLAEMAQSTPQIGFVRRAVAAIRTWLRTHVPGFKSLALTDAELIRNYILPARAWVERGAPDGGDKADATFSREAAPEMRTAANFLQARQAVKEFQGKPLTNVVTGMQAVVSRKTLDKMLSSKAVSKSESATAHATAVANVDHLFEQAIWGWSKPDRDADTNFEAIHRFFAPMAYGDKQLLVKLTVKEVKLSGQSNPLYTVEAVELNESKRGKQWVEQAMQDDGLDPQKRNPLQREWADEIAGEADPNSTLAQPRGMNPGRSAEDVHSLAQAVERSNTDEPMFSRSRFMDLKDSALGLRKQGVRGDGSANSEAEVIEGEALIGDAPLSDRIKKTLSDMKHWDRQRKALEDELIELELDAFLDEMDGDGPGAQASDIDARMSTVERIQGALVQNLANLARESESLSDPVIDAIRNGSSSTTVLELVASKSNNPEYRELAKRLISLGVAPKVSLVQGYAEAVEANARLVAQGSYAPMHGVKIAPIAAAYGSAHVEHVFLHEMVHAATILALKKNTQGASNLRALYRQVKSSGDANGFYGLKDIGEFAAEAFTNVAFQDAMRAMPAPEGSGKPHRTVWEAFVDAIRSMLGMSPRVARGGRTMLDAVLDAGRIVMDDDRALKDRGAKDNGTEDHFFGTDEIARVKAGALDFLQQSLSHPGKVSLWDKSVGTMRHLAERNPVFKPVFEAASQNIEDVSMLANDAADAAPRLIPRVESLRDMLGKDRKKPVSAADNKAVGKPLFEGTLIWGRDENGKATLVEDLQKRHANLSVHNKAAMLLKQGKIDSGVLAMWQGKPLEQFEKLIDSRFESVFLKPGIVWSDTELQSLFGANANQISLYREARAAIDRSIDMTARTDMLRVVGEKYEAMRDAVLGQPSVEAAAQLLLDTLEQDAKADPDSRDRLGEYMQQIKRRMETATDLQKAGYAPLSRFGRYTVDVVDANGERQYFGMYETARDSNLAKMQLAQEFKGATITTGTMSAQAYKLFAGVTPETLEQFGEMLGLKSEGNEAQDKAFQEFLKLTKNNHSAMKRMIHRQGIAGFSQDVGRVVANFVYSNARAGAMGLNAGKMDTAIGAIPKEQGELKDLAMGLRSYIRDPQEEGQAVRGMLFAQYLGGSLASAFVNMTQPFQITMPWLSQYGGMKKAGTQMARALKDMGTKGFQYEADLAKALQAAEDDGTVSPQEVHQLMAQARGAGGLRSGDGTRTGDARAQASNLWEKGKVLWGQPFALAEQFNRRSTFIASYRIAKEQGMVDPAGFARKAVLETQFVYSKANKPKWARGAVGGTLFTFKTYSVSYLELMQRMWTQGGPEGKRAVGWALAMLVLMGGAGGLPFMEDAEDLIDGAGQLMGYNLSSKQWRKELMADAVGKELADFMEQGISGLPGAPIDVSGRLGMGNLLPGTGLFLEKPNRERDLTEIVGPVGDLVTRGFSGARDVIKGVLTGDAATAGKGVLEWTPTAVRNAFKGADMATSGMYKDGKGYKVIDTTLAEAAAKAIGFQPKSVAEVQEANSFMQRSKSFYTQTSSEIKAQWADALFRKDEAAVKRVRERLADWNRDNPEQPIVVKMPDVWKKVREMGKARSDRIADTAPKALRAQMREEAAALRS